MIKLRIKEIEIILEFEGVFRVFVIYFYMFFIFKGCGGKKCYYFVLEFKGNIEYYYG